MGHEYPPQKLCDRCGMADFEYPYVSYTGQIPQVTRVTFSADYLFHNNGGGTHFDKVGIDLGYLCQDCRKELFEWFIGCFSKGWKDYPKRVDEYKEHFTLQKNGKSTDEHPLPWWEHKIVIKSHTGKVLKDGVFV